MTEQAQNPSLKEINALKKKLNWGDVPAIYRMATTAIGDLDGILSHGFDSAYKNILDRTTWNLDLLQGYKDAEGNLQVKIKPKIALRHSYSESHYELHCYPIVYDEKLNRELVNDPACPFINWYPEVSRRLFRVSSLVSFMIYAYSNGDKADMALIKYAYLSIENLISILSESFEITEIKGYNIAEFYAELNNRKESIELQALYDQNQQEESES